MERMIKHLKRVGVLQDLGDSFVSLYVDLAERELFVFTLLSPPKSSNPLWIASKVDPNDVEEYMNEEKGLVDLYTDKRIWQVEKGIRDFYFSEVSDFHPSNDMICLNSFDTELCSDDIWIETFMGRLLHNRPLEIG